MRQSVAGYVAGCVAGSVRPLPVCLHQWISLEIIKNSFYTSLSSKGTTTTAHHHPAPSSFFSLCASPTINPQLCLLVPERAEGRGGQRAEAGRDHTAIDWRRECCLLHETRVSLSPNCKMHLKWRYVLTLLAGWDPGKSHTCTAIRR